MVKTQYWVKAKTFSGLPTKEDFKLVEEDLPELKDGGPELYFTILMKRLTIRGCMLLDATKERWLEAYADLSRWVKEGKLKYREHITSGFDKMPEVFIKLFTGANTGKAIVKY